MGITKTVVKFWSGAYPDKLEAWLEHMELSGWHLVNVHWGGVKFVFEKGESSTISYSLDYRAQVDEDYVGLLEDTGWELVFKSGGWFIWRKSYEEIKPELYTDIDSLVERNKRLLMVYGVLMLTQVPLAVLNVQHFTIWAYLLLYIPVFCIVGTAFAQTLHANWKLKSKANKGRN